MIEKADNAMKKAIAINPMAEHYSSHYRFPLGEMKGLLEQYDKPTSYYSLPEYKQALGENMKFAKQEAKFNLTKDVFGNAFDFQIGKPVIVDKRVCVQYYPKSASRKGVWAFGLPEFPADYDLTICGRLGQDGDVKPTIRITLNKMKLYEGPAKFTFDSWTSMSFKITWVDLDEKNNKLTIENISPREKWSKPLTYYINYAVVKPEGKKGGDGKDDQMNLDGLMK